MEKLIYCARSKIDSKLIKYMDEHRNCIDDEKRIHVNVFIKTIIEKLKPILEDGTVQEPAIFEQLISEILVFKYHPKLKEQIHLIAKPIIECMQTT